MSRKYKRYTDSFKKQIVELINAGKSYKEIVSEYSICRSTISKWVHDYNKTKSFKAKDNRTPEENELIEVKKENALLKMENDILKQAALILGRK